MTAESSIEITAELASQGRELTTAPLGPKGEELDSMELVFRTATLNATASQSGTYYVQIRQGPVNPNLLDQSRYELTANVSSGDTPIRHGIGTHTDEASTPLMARRAIKNEVTTMLAAGGSR